jgi:hypothetical protein
VLNRKRAERSTDPIKKVELFSKTMDLCEGAIANLSQTDHRIFLEEEVSIMHSIGDLDGLDLIIERLAKEYKNASGYRLKASILYKNSFERSGDQRTQVLEEAYELTEEGLDVENTDQGLLRLNAKIGIELFSTDIDAQYKILKKWYDFSDQSDLKLLFKYGIILFELDYYEDSKKIFEDLDFQSQGLPQRSSIFKSYFIRQNNENKKYHGKIKYLAPNDRKGYVECTSLPNLKYELPFFPSKFSPAEGDYAVFNIGFSMRGIFAFDVRKD